MHRFFVPPEWIGESRVALHEDTARQVNTVLRMRPGDELIVLDNAGWEYHVTLDTVSAKSVTGDIMRKARAQGEPSVTLTLVQALLKKDNFEWVLQKCTEIGVSRFVPVESQRAVVPASSANAKKLARWERILTEAAEQSRRGRVPTLDNPQALSDVWAHRDSYDLVLVPWEDESTRALHDVLAAHPDAKQIALVIGPEGGFAPDEIDAARAHGAIPVTLGPRILRAETAAVVASALVLYERGALELSPD